MSKLCGCADCVAARNWVRVFPMSVLDGLFEEAQERGPGAMFWLGDLLSHYAGVVAGYASPSKARLVVLEGQLDQMKRSMEGQARLIDGDSSAAFHGETLN